MKFGVRECADITFKALDDMKIGKSSFVAGQPVFMIDTAQTSELTQESTTVYAQGGRGYNRLISWEGEKAVTFTVTDALMSPMGLAVLSGAGLIKAAEENVAHVHVTYDVTLDKDGIGSVKFDKLADELGWTGDKLQICTDVPIFATVLDGSGAGIEWIASEDIAFTDDVTDKLIEVSESKPFQVTIVKAKSKTVKLDFYCAFNNGVTTVEIKPEDFGGFFYVEADTLFRREDTGKDMAASIVFPKVKVQSGFTFTMAGSGDPSTFDFTMDAMPGYTWFDRTKKVNVVMQIVGEDKTGETVEDNFHPTVVAEKHNPKN